MNVMSMAITDCILVQASKALNFFKQRLFLSYHLALFTAKAT